MPNRPVQVPTRPGLEHLFGRHINHDPRSRSFAYSWEGSLESAEHELMINILLQRVGSCTGNAMLYLLGTEPFYGTLVNAEIEPAWTEHTAEDLYSRATAIDPFDGEWPPTDTGSDGNSVNVAAREMNLIRGWQHALSTNAALMALSEQPIMIGVNWYDSMLHTDAEGQVAIGRRAKIVGGHEVCLRWIDVAKERLGGPNSWGPKWGDRGEFWMSFKTFDRLMNEDGDATVPTPLDMPKPVPTPPTPPVPPAPGYSAEALWADMKALAAQHGLD